MQVARLYDFGDIRVEESARPQVGPNHDILVRASACGICSGDIMPWYIRRKAPLVLGHEPVGIVEEAGAAVREFRPGDRVFVHHHAPCFQCAGMPPRRIRAVRDLARDQHRPGGMAEYFLVSAANQRDTLQASRLDRRRRRRADRARRMRSQIAQALGPETRRNNSDHRARDHGHDAREDGAASRRRDDHRRGLISLARAAAQSNSAPIAESSSSATTSSSRCAKSPTARWPTL